MQNKRLILAADFLDLLIEKLFFAGCNDWEWPEDWSKSERNQFAMEYYQLIGHPEDYEPGMDLTDNEATRLLADELRNMAEQGE